MLRMIDIRSNLCYNYYRNDNYGISKTQKKMKRSDIMWRWQYDEYYVEMEKDFEKYQNLDPEMEEVVSRHYRNGR